MLVPGDHAPGSVRASGLRPCRSAPRSPTLVGVALALLLTPVAALAADSIVGRPSRCQQLAMAGCAPASPSNHCSYRDLCLGMDAASFREHAKVFASLVDGLASQHLPKEPDLSLSDIRAKDGRVYSFVVRYSPHAVPDGRTLVAKLSEKYGPPADTTHETETDKFTHGFTMTTHHLWRSDAASITLDIRKTIFESLEPSYEYTLRFSDVDVEAGLTAAAEEQERAKRKTQEDSFVP